jgi:hypothetical protein
MIAPDATLSDCRLADGVLVINLDHRPERMAQFEKMARPLGMFRGWQRIAAVNGVDIPGYGKPPWFRNGKRDKCWAGRAGCTLSHRKAIEHARDMGWSSVLILEDDIQLGAGFETSARDFLNRTAACADTWGACFLGLSKQVGPSRKLIDLDHARATYEIFGCIGAFAYILKRESFDWILANLPSPESVWTWISRHRAIDRWYARNLSRRCVVHAVSPNLIGHYSSFSDIGQRAGANLIIEDCGSNSHDPLRDCGKTAFVMRCRLLRGRFQLARIANELRGALKRIRGL